MPAGEGSHKRKVHTKSRRGCRNCKLRRVKVSHAGILIGNDKLLTLSLSATRQGPSARNALLLEFPVILIRRTRIFRCPLMEQQLSRAHPARNTQLTNRLS